MNAAVFADGMGHKQRLLDHLLRDAEPRNARALFKRLASNVGNVLRSPDPQMRDESLRVSADDAAARSAIEAGSARVSHAPRPSEGAAGSLDRQGREAAQPAPKEHIEIPSFLRKHG